MRQICHVVVTILDRDHTIWFTLRLRDLSLAPVQPGTLRMLFSWFSEHTESAFDAYLWIDVMGVSLPVFTQLFLTSGPICSACAENQWGSETTAALRYPLINLIWQSFFFFAPFLLVNGSTTVIRSVFAPHAGLSHTGHWPECTQWVTEEPLGSWVARWPIMKR